MRRWSMSWDAGAEVRKAQDITAILKMKFITISLSPIDFNGV